MVSDLRGDEGLADRVRQQKGQWQEHAHRFGWHDTAGAVRPQATASLVCPNDWSQALWPMI
jgi:hypothetical protein